LATNLQLEIVPQPDDMTCGPTCLHAVYAYWDDPIGLDRLLAEVRMLPAGGTLDVFLANHALARGYDVTIFTYNLHVFDPSWFPAGADALSERLRRQREVKRDGRLQAATAGYLRFLELGGKVRYEDLTTSLIRRYLKKGVPIMTGLSATYLYRSAREIPDTMAADDIRGEPCGHFVVLSGYDRRTRQVKVADPYRANPYSADGYYPVDIRRLIGAVFLGIATYDANLLVIRPRGKRA
jgi:hypothetical protein